MVDNSFLYRIGVSFVVKLNMIEYVNRQCDYRIYAVTFSERFHQIITKNEI